MSVLDREVIHEADDRREVRALGWLTVGLVLGPLGLAVGWYHVLTAPRWPLRDKVLAALLPLLVATAFLISTNDLGGDPPPALGWVIALSAVAAVVGIVVHLRRSARTYRGFRTLHPWGAMVVAVVAALGVADAHHLPLPGTYDYAGRLVDAADSADERGQRYEVISEASADRWSQNDSLTRSEAAHLHGPGNDRFIGIFQDLVAEDDDLGEPGLPSEPCYVFPVVEDESGDIHRVTGMAQFCYGPSHRTTYVAISDR